MRTPYLEPGTLNLEPITLIDAKLRRAWHKERRYYHTRGICHVLVWLVALIVLDFAVDWLLEIPGWARVLLLAINVATLAVVVHRNWLRYLKAYDRTRVALEVEGRHPELESLLVSFVQLGGDSHTDASPALLRAMERQAIEVTGPLDFRDIINFGQLKRIFIVSAAVFLLFCGLSVNWSEHFHVLMLRLFNPGSELKYPTRTHIAEHSGNLNIKQGDNAELRARVTGLVPQQGTLFYRPKDGDWKKLPVMLNDKDELAYVFQNVFEGFQYYMRIGDAKTEPFSVSVVPPPRLTEAQLQLTYPAYTKLKEKAVNTLSPDVVEGTSVDWLLHLEPAVAKVDMIREGGAVMPLELDATGRVAKLKLPAKTSFGYQLRWTEKQHNFAYDEGVQHFVRVLPDTPPEVDIVQPTGDDKATVNKKLTVSFRAADDFGVAKVFLAYSINEGEEKKVPIDSFTGKPVEALSWKLKDALPNLKEGDVVAYAIEALDTYDGKDGPHVGRSQTRRVTILSVAEYQQYVYETLANLTGEIKKSHEVEIEASEQVKVLKVGE